MKISHAIVAFSFLLPTQFLAMMVALPTCPFKKEWDLPSVEMFLDTPEAKFIYLCSKKLEKNQKKNTKEPSPLERTQRHKRKRSPWCSCSFCKMKRCKVRTPKKQKQHLKKKRKKRKLSHNDLLCYEDPWVSHDKKILPGSNQDYLLNTFACAYSADNFARSVAAFIMLDQPIQEELKKLNPHLLDSNVKKKRNPQPLALPPYMAQANILPKRINPQIARLNSHLPNPNLQKTLTKSRLLNILFSSYHAEDHIQMLAALSFLPESAQKEVLKLNPHLLKPAILKENSSTPPRPKD